MSTARISPADARDDAIDRVGRALYGGDWIGSLETWEWDLARKAGPEIPADGEDAKRYLRARFRSEASDIQHEMIFRWLRERGVNCVAEQFDHKDFERRFLELFPNAAPLQVRRRAAIKQRVDAGERPGRGGNVQWKEFAVAIRADCGGADFDMKTLQRDYNDLYPAEAR